MKKINLSLGNIDEVGADEYAKKWLKRIKGQSDKNILLIIDRIYEDGLTDGYNAGIEDMEEAMKTGAGLKFKTKK